MEADAIKADFHQLRLLQRLIKKFRPYAFPNLQSCHVCKLPMSAAAGGVEIVTGTTAKGTRHAWYRGLQHCNNAWACPVCSHRKGFAECRRMNAILNGAEQKGMKVYQLTFKTVHYNDMAAVDILNAMNKALRAVTGECRRGMQNGAQAKNPCRFSFLMADAELVGYAVARECTFTHNGFNFHAHTLWVFKGEPEWDELLFYINRRYTNTLVRHLPKTDKLKAALEVGKVDINNSDLHQLVHLTRTENGEPKLIHYADYWAGFEFSGGPVKVNHDHRENSTSKTFGEMLESGKPGDWARIAEFLDATRARQRVNVSITLLRIFKAEIAAAVAAGEADEAEDANAQESFTETTTVATFTSYGWHIVIQRERTLRVDVRANLLLAAIEGGYEAVVAYCESLKIPLPLRGKQSPFNNYVRADPTYTAPVIEREGTLDHYFRVEKGRQCYLELCAAIGYEPRASILLPHPLAGLRSYPRSY